MRAGEAWVKIYGDDNPLQQTLAAASDRLGSWADSVSQIGTTMLAAGAAMTAPMALSAKGFTSAAMHLLGASLAANESAGRMSQLRGAAARFGIDGGLVDTALPKLNREVQAAVAGSRSASAALNALGLSAEQLAKLSPVERFHALSAAIAATPDKAAAAGAAMAIFGDSARELWPLLSAGKGKLAELTAEAIALGDCMSDTQVAAARGLSFAMNETTAIARRMANALGEAVTPSLLSITRAGNAWAQTAVDFVRSNREIIATGFRAASAIASIGAALASVSVVKGLGGKVLAPLLPLGKMIAGGLSAALPVAGPFLAIAAGASIAAKLAGVSFTEQFAAIRRAGQWAADEMTARFPRAAETIGQLGEQIRAGNWAGAAKTALAGVELAFAETTASVRRLWVTAMEAMDAAGWTASMQGAWIEVQGLWEKGSIFLTTIANGTMADVIDAWKWFGENATALWQLFTETLSGSWDWICTEFRGVWDYVSSIFSGSVNGMGEIWNSIAEYAAPVLNWLSSAWAKVVNSLGDIWGKFCEKGFVETWLDAQNAVTNWMVDLMAKFDSNIDPEREKRDINREFEKKKQAWKAQAAEVDAKTVERKKDIATPAELDEARKSQRDKIDADLQAARDKWKEDLKNAKKAKEPGQAEGDKMPDPAKPASSSAPARSIAGNFNPFVALQSGAGSYNERTARATEKMSYLMMKHLEATRDMKELLAVGD